MSDEQRVRTMARWIGVEISRSRVRTPGKAGYGLYRVRAMPRSTDLPEDLEEMWTAYAFTLDEIGRSASCAISLGRPESPASMEVCPAVGGQLVTVPTRWTSAYRGRRDLGKLAAGGGLCGRPQRHEDGCACLADGVVRWLPDEPSAPVAVSREYAAEVSALDALVGAGLVMVRHVGSCSCDDDRYTVACVRETMTAHRAKAADCRHGALERCPYGVSIGEHPHEPAGCDRGGEPHTGPCMTVRQRRRAGNAAFQSEHAVRRDAGLRARHAAKLGRNVMDDNDGEG